MVKAKKIYGFIGLKLTNFLPANGSIANLGQQRIRAHFARKFLNRCGRNVNVQKNTRFSHKCYIGDNSGIGEGSNLFGEVILGNNVMMGPQCLIYTQNHAFDRLDIPMIEQGPQFEKKVVICLLYTSPSPRD